MTAALIFVAALLFAGVLLRRRFGIFTWLFIPASVLAGAVGLLVVQLTIALGRGAKTAAEPAIDDSFASQLAQHIQGITSELASWPSWLIAVVFATLLLERSGEKVSRGARGVFSESIMVWIIVLGQTAVGLLLTWLFIQPRWAVPNSFGMLIETGFAGGHGTAAAMGQVFQSPAVGLDGGLGLGILMATAGLIYGVISGIFWINIGMRKGWAPIRSITTTANDSFAQALAPHHREQSETTTNRTATPSGNERIPSDLIEPLLLQTIWIAFAFAIGMALQWMVAFGAETIDVWLGETWLSDVGSGEASQSSVTSESPSTQPSASTNFVTVVSSFPMFIYTLIGGWIVRRILVYFERTAWIDSATISKLSTIAMDILVVAAMTSLNLKAVYELFGPMLILLLGGCVWTSFCLVFLAKRILPSRHWFELGLINYGMSTGTTATGFVLLRMVDPELDSDAPEDYALAAPFSAPFIGGGMLTTGLPLLVLERFPIALIAILFTAAVFLLIGLGAITQDRSP